MLRYREISFTCAFRASLIFCPTLPDQSETRSSFGSSLLFALSSSSFPGLTLGEFFSMQLAGRVRVGRILSPGIREQPPGFAQSPAPFLRLSRTLSPLLSHRNFRSLFFQPYPDAPPFRATSSCAFFLQLCQNHGISVIP